MPLSQRNPLSAPTRSSRTARWEWAALFAGGLLVGSGCSSTDPRLTACVVACTHLNASGCTATVMTIQKNGGCEAACGTAIMSVPAICNDLYLTQEKCFATAPLTCDANQDVNASLFAACAAPNRASVECVKGNRAVGGDCSDTQNVVTCPSVRMCPKGVSDCSSMNSPCNGTAVTYDCVSTGGGSAYCCPLAGAPCNHATDCCPGLSCNKHVCSTSACAAAVVPDAGTGNNNLVCGVIYEWPTQGYVGCECYTGWTRDQAAASSGGMGAISQWDVRACPALASSLTGQSMTLDCCSRGQIPINGNGVPVGDSCQCTTSMGFPHGMADCDAWASETSGFSRTPSCP